MQQHQSGSFGIELLVSKHIIHQAGYSSEALRIRSTQGIQVGYPGHTFWGFQWRTQAAPPLSNPHDNVLDEVE